MTETNLEGCTGEPVCVEVLVEDDVWRVDDASQTLLQAFPVPTSNQLTLVCGSELVGAKYQVVSVLGAEVMTGRFESPTETLDVQSLPSGHYVVRPERGQPLPFQIQR